jgi:copper resistance protein C
MQSFRMKTAFAPVFLLFLLVLPGVSLGHAFPDHSDPKVGATVSGSPSNVRIWFDGDLEPVFSTITVQNAVGKKVDKGDGRVNQSNPKLLEVNVLPLQAGTYRVFWNIAARDGHRTMGDYTFMIK